MKTLVFIFILSIFHVTRTTEGQINTRFPHPFSVQNPPKEVPYEPQWSGGDYDEVHPLDSKLGFLQFTLSRGDREISLRSSDQEISQHDGQTYSKVKTNLKNLIDSSRIAQHDGQTYSKLKTNLKNLIDSSRIAQHDGQTYSKLKTNLKNLIDSSRIAQHDGQTYSKLKTNLKNLIDSSRIAQHDGQTYSKVKKNLNNSFLRNNVEEFNKHIQSPTHIRGVAAPIAWLNVTDKNRREDRHVSHTEKFIDAALESHNVYRRKHKAYALTYSKKVASVSQAYADKLIVSLAKGGPLVHNPNKNGYGENLWCFWSSPPRKMTDEDAVKAAVKSWYKEIKFYKQFFGREPDMTNFMKWGHFTQVVWKSSVNLGMGIARKKGYILIVANYDPAGNMRGKFAKNVNKPQN
ncbi:hypothetical protein WDU94_000851 [Cyamophila willieti]